MVALLFVLLPALWAQVAAPLPIDSKVRYGRLDNGLTYYIRHNELPKGRADFYIVHNVGSVLEEENQRGLAHFLEHMAFDGSKHLTNEAWPISWSIWPLTAVSIFRMMEWIIT